MKRCVILGIMLLVFCIPLCACAEKNQKHIGDLNTTVPETTFVSADATETIELESQATEQTYIDYKEMENVHQTEQEETMIETTFKFKEENVPYGENMTDKG